MGAEKIQAVAFETVVLGLDDISYFAGDRQYLSD